MRLRHTAIWSVGLLVVTSAFPQEHAYRFYDLFRGRYHCGGQWAEIELKPSPVTGPLGIADPDGGVTASITIRFSRSITQLDAAVYRLTGKYDEKSGHFRLEPEKWMTPHPAVFEMFGLEGTFDSDNQKMTAHMLSAKCDAVELVAPSQAPPVWSQAQPQPRATAADSGRPEKSLVPTNVTNYLDVAARSPDFEYWVTAWSDPPGAVHESEPIDEAVDRMKHDQFACVGTEHVTWDAAGSRGTAPGQIGITQRFVIECLGDCRGVFYRPWVGANVTHFGLSAPLPTLQIKSVWAGGTTFRWNFSRTTNTQPPPEIYVHRWTPLTGFGPLDPGPDELARRIAEAPPCRAAKAQRK